MPRADVAPLAEHRELRDEHAIVVGPVRVVAGVAGLAHRRVVPEIGPALLGVAADARLVDPVADLEHPDVGRSVRVVARRAVHLAFAQRHVARPLKLGDLGLVARRAGLHHRRRLELRLLGLGRMNAVARHARQVARVVHPALPVRVAPTVVARQARLRHVARRHRGEHLDVALAARVDVRLAGPVAGLAALAAGGRSRVSRLPMERVLQRLAFDVMAARTRVGADVTVGLRGRRARRRRGHAPGPGRSGLRLRRPSTRGRQTNRHRPGDRKHR